jgi:hypothetical protein
VLRFFETQKLVAMGGQIAVGLVCFFCWFSWKNIKYKELLFLLFFLIVIFFAGSFSFSSSDMKISSGPLFLGAFMLSTLALARLVSLADLEKTTFFILYFLNLLFYFKFILDNRVGLPVNFFEASSYNLLSSIFIFLTAGLMVVVPHRKGLIILALLFLVFLCFSLHARASISVSIALLLWFLIFRLKLFYFFALVLGFSFFILTNLDFMETVFQLTKFADKGLDSPRWIMLNNYFASISVQSLLFGVDLSSVDVIKDYNDNPHNFLVRFHSYYGLFGLIFFIACVIYVFIKSSFYNFGIFCLLLVRSVTDIGLLPGPLLDLPLFLIVFAITKSSKSEF